MGETAATEVKRRWNAEGARNAPVAKSLEKQGLEAWKWKEACQPVNGYDEDNHTRLRDLCTIFEAEQLFCPDSDRHNHAPI